MKASHPSYRPQNPHNQAFYPTPLPPQCRTGLPQGLALSEQRFYYSLFGIDLGITHTWGRAPQTRWAFNFVAIWCLLHLDLTKGFVAELKLRLKKISIDDFRKLFTDADFTGFDPGRLRTLGDFSLTDRCVASAFRKAISRNFKREFPLSDYEIERGYRPKRVKLDADHICEDLKPTFEMLETGKRTAWVMQPGEWLTPEEWTRIEPDRYILVYAPAQTCKKGGRRVK